MKFYIELTDDISTFRLQSDLSWRKIETRDIQDIDFLTPDVYELIKIQEVNGQIKLNNKNWKLNPTSSLFGEKQKLNYRIFTIRCIKPPIPSRDQLISVIAQGDDRINNSLILNVHGLFELRDFYTLNLSFKDPTIVLRNETFSAGNGYVGKDAAKDANLIKGLYAVSLYHWLIHLQNGLTNMYSDTIMTDKPINELIKEIEDIKI